MQSPDDMASRFEVQGARLERQDGHLNILGVYIFIYFLIVAMCRYSWPMRSHYKTSGVHRMCDGTLWGRGLRSKEPVWSARTVLWIFWDCIFIFIFRFWPCVDVPDTSESTTKHQESLDGTIGFQGVPLEPRYGSYNILRVDIFIYFSILDVCRYS